MPRLAGDGGDRQPDLVLEAPGPVLARLERADQSVCRSPPRGRRRDGSASCRSTRRDRSSGRSADAARDRRSAGSPRSPRPTPAAPRAGPDRDESNSPSPTNHASHRTPTSDCRTDRPTSPPDRNRMPRIHRRQSVDEPEPRRVLMAEDDRTMPLSRITGHDWLLSGAPDGKLPESGMPAAGRDAADRAGAGARRRPAAQPRDVRDHLDGARGPADHRREPAPQLHRPRRVPAHGRDRAALHPDAGRPLPRPRRDHRRAHPGLLGGDHARRAGAEVEVAQAARGGRQADRPAEPGLRRRRARRLGEVLPLLRRRAADRPAPGGTSTRSAPRTSSRTSTRTRSASPPCSAPRSPATPTTSSASTTCWSG